MRSGLLLVLAFLLAGCGGSSAPPPTPTPALPGVTDHSSRVTTSVIRTRERRGYILVDVMMHNAGHATFNPTNPTQFIDEALVEPNSRGTVGVCSADDTAGAPLQFASIPAGATRTGWLRCDYPSTTHVVAIFWLRYDLGNYRVTTG